MNDVVKISVDELIARVGRVFVAARTSEDNAQAVATALVQAEVDGQKGHGLSRVESYSAQSKAGKVDGFAAPTLQQGRPGGLLIDAQHGFAYPAVSQEKSAFWVVKVSPTTASPRWTISSVPSTLTCSSSPKNGVPNPPWV